MRRIGRAKSRNEKRGIWATEVVRKGQEDRWMFGNKERFEKRSQGLVVWDSTYWLCLYGIAIYSRIVSIVVLVLCVSNVVECLLAGFSGWIRTPLNRPWVSRFAPKPRGFFRGTRKPISSSSSSCFFLLLFFTLFLICPVTRNIPVFRNRCPEWVARDSTANRSISFFGTYLFGPRWVSNWRLVFW